MGKTSTSTTHKQAVNKTAKTLSTPKLTPKQKKFCNSYLTNGYNAAKAARDAGYSAKTAKFIASENLSKPYLKEYLAQQIQKDQEKFEYTKEIHFKELDDLETLARNTGNVASAIKAAELKGKLCGLYIEKQEIKAQVVSGFAVDQFLEKFNAKQ